MSGYLMKPAGGEAEARIDWREGYLEPGEWVEGDLGWSVAPADGAEAPRIMGQAVEPGASLARVGQGVPGQVYMLCARAVTNTGRALERAIVLRIADEGARA